MMLKIWSMCKILILQNTLFACLSKVLGKFTAFYQDVYVKVSVADCFYLASCHDQGMMKVPYEWLRWKNQSVSFF